MKPSQVSAAVKHCLAVQRPVFIWGAVGVGKSELMAKVAADTGRELRDVRLSLMDPVDLKGFPMPNVEKGQMTWLPPDFLPAMTVKKGSKQVPNDSKGVVFLDEMNSALPAVQAAAYQLILNRRIGDYVLPAGWDIVAAGNRSKDRSVVNAMPAALSNRLVHIDYEVNLDEWCSWAIDNGITPGLIAFLRFRSELLHSFNPVENPRSFPTPRTWFFADQVLGSKLEPNVEFELLKGTVGEGAAGECMAFMRIVRDLPSIDQIMIDPDSVPVPAELNVKYAVATTLAARASRDNMDRLMKYINRIPTEFQVVFTRDAARRDIDVTKAKSYTDWAIKNSDVLI